MTRDDDVDPYEQPYPTQTPTAPAAPSSQKRFNTTASWSDPYHAPLPGDPYYAEWQAANPGIPESAAPPTGNQVDVYGNPYGAKGTETPNPGPTPGPAPGPAPAPGGPAPTPPPSVAPPVPTPPPAFHYDDFTPPDPNDLSSDKGFQFENAQGMQAIGARNAALGTLNTGGTLKDYVSFGQNLAHTRYGDLFNRALMKYGANRGNALDAYNTNYNTQVKDPWNESMQRASLEQNNNQFNSTQAFNTWLENYKRSTLDPFDQRYKTLSLL